MTQQPLSTTAPPITTHPSSLNPNRSNHQTSHLRPKQNPNQKIFKNTHTHNGNSTKLTLQPPSPLIMTQQLPFTIHIRNPTTKLLTAEYSVRFVVKPALKPFRWRSCWSRVWNFRLELEREIFFGVKKKRERFFGREEERFSAWFVNKREKLQNVVWYMVIKWCYTPSTF